MTKTMTALQIYNTSDNLSDKALDLLAHAEKLEAMLTALTKKNIDISSEGKTHVDDFIDYNYGKDCYARWMFNYFRLPAILKIDFTDLMKDYKLFCTYKEEKYRCTGASRMGDVWLTKDFTQESGYQLRVILNECTDWSPT